MQTQRAVRMRFWKKGLFKKYPPYKFILAFMDFFALALAFFIALKVRFWPHIDLINSPDYFIHPLYWPLIVYSGLSIFIFQYNNLYKRHVFISIVQQFILILKTIIIIISGLILISFLSKFPQHIVDSRLVIVYSTIGLFLLVSFFRLIVFRNFFRLFVSNKIVRRRVLILGAGESGKIVAASMLIDKKYGLELVGFVDDYIEKGKEIFHSLEVIGNTEQIEDIVNIYRIDEIILCLSNISYERLTEVIEQCKKTNCLIQVYSDLYEIINQKIVVEKFSEFPLVSVGLFNEIRINRTIKRIIDIVGSSVSLVALSPLFLLITAAVKINSPGKVIFKQTRLGKNAKPFTLYKFRTMKTNKSERIHREYSKNFIKSGTTASQKSQKNIYKVLDDPRVTRIGKILRKTSWDELPQLLNVFKGEMSLVGPRPCLPYEYENYNPWHKQRMKATPGITGLWQISGRSSVTFNDMVILDVYYIGNMSPWFDLQIMLKTIPVVFFGRGAY